MYRVSLVSVGPDFRLPTTLQSGCFHIDRDVVHAGEASPDDGGSGAGLGHELLNKEMFYRLGHAKQALGLWQHDFNNVRRKSGIGGVAPAARLTLSQCGSIAQGAPAKPQTWRYQQTALS
jgi:transposase InsO family protein